MNKKVTSFLPLPSPQKTHTHMHIQHPELFSPSLNLVLLYPAIIAVPSILASKHPASLLPFSPYLIQ